MRQAATVLCDDVYRELLFYVSSRSAGCPIGCPIGCPTGLQGTTVLCDDVLCVQKDSGGGQSLCEWQSLFQFSLQLEIEDRAHLWAG